MEGIHEILERLDSSIQRDVLATIIDVQGSAYLKEGASMLFREDGTQIGLLSAGCLEEDIKARVEDKSHIEFSQTIAFDMSAEDDLTWGQGSGCNGVLQVLLETVDSCLRSHLITLRTYLEEGKSVIVAKRLKDDLSVSDYVFITENHQFGKWEGDFSCKIHSYLHSRNRIEKNGIVYMNEFSSYVYFQHYLPKPRLVIFGAGRDARPLVEFAAEAGFTVLVSDWRPALCNKNYFPKASDFIVGFPDKAIQQIQIRKEDYVVLLTHSFQRDQEILQCLLHEKLNYLGVLGSKKRTMRLLNYYEKNNDIHSPIGLPIGAEGPEEIAISIVADLIRVKHLLLNSKVQAV